MSRVRWAAIAIACAVMLWHCWWWKEFVVDDAAITYAYSLNLAHGDGAVIRAGGERVEGYSNFLWMVLLAIGALFRIDIFSWARILGAALAVTLVVGVAELSAALRGRRSIVDALPALFAATLTPISYWCMSGLEGPLYMNTLVWCAQRLIVERDDPERRPLSAGFAAAAALTRPDGWLVCLAACGLRLVGDRRPQKLMSWFALALGPVALHIAWRYSYYAHIFPNTYYAKTRTPFRLREFFVLNGDGWRYVMGNYHAYELARVAAVAALSLVAWRRLHARLVVAVIFVSTLSFAIYSRGDWMSEGRFVVTTLPLLAALVACGVETIVGLVARKIPRWESAIAALLIVAALEGATRSAIKHTKARHGFYPNPVEAVAGRARAYSTLAQAIRIERPSVMEGDLGGTALYANMPVVDMGALADVTFAKQFNRHAMLREYVLDERRPSFAMLLANWGWYHFQEYPEFQDRYTRLERGELSRVAVWLARASFVVDGIDTRAPLHKLDGVDLIGVETGPSELRLWLLVRGPGPLPIVFGDSERVPISVAADHYARNAWRAGEVVLARARRPAGALKLCVNQDCVPLIDGGARPISLPEAKLRGRLLARGELLAVAAIDARSGARELAGPLYRRGRDFESVGDFDRAFLDYRAALQLDVAHAFARLHLEIVRGKRQSTHYSGRWRVHLGEAVRAFHLQPDADTLAKVVRAAVAAREPEAAVRAHLATGIVPSDGRLDLADCYFALGLPERAAELLPEPTTLDEAARVMRIAHAADRPGLAESAAKILKRGSVSVGGGLTMTAAWANPTRGGLVELSLALVKQGEPTRALTVGDRDVPFERAPAGWAAGEVYIHRIILDLPSGRAPVRVGTAQITVENRVWNGEFENGRADGWQPKDKFPSQPVRTGSGRPYGNSGSWYLDSFGGADLKTGEIESPPLADGLDRICFTVGGGAVFEKYGVALVVDGAEVQRAAGKNDDHMREACFDLAAHRGKAARIRLYDRWGGGWGHVEADDFECEAGGRPAPCGGPVEVSM